MGTSELQPILREALQPEGDDLEMLAGRPDDKFSQKVRNLRSHSRLERDDLATFDGAKYHITAAGEHYLQRYGGVDASYSKQGFGEVAKKKALSPRRPIKFVEEGDITNVNATVRRRSRWLRNYAVKYFSDPDGRIKCVGCEFEASAIYGNDYMGLIEIHHKIPIALAGDTTKPLRQALEHVAPLCPNCHRIVHSRQSHVLRIEELQALVSDVSSSWQEVRLLRSNL
ncbi:HNH endonuclease [Mesobacterium pallidum]|uniref:HNH endonuclease n=1 Tax=Mesobacterium pallidum TaxID=2872037 RepID=UPI001EE2B7E5|nr:HNH endonuclease [Mesobacterium pallidum]